MSEPVNMTPSDRGEPEWHRDPAASGWRSRAWVKCNGRQAELQAYDDGDWVVRLGGSLKDGANGHEPDAESAKARAILVWKAYMAVLRHGEGRDG